MSRRLATRHITTSPHGPQMLHDTVAGRITLDGKGQIALIVDGIQLRIEDIESILRSHEGWEFELRIVDAVE